MDDYTFVLGRFDVDGKLRLMHVDPEFNPWDEPLSCLPERKAKDAIGHRARYSTFLLYGWETGNLYKNKTDLDNHALRRLIEEQRDMGNIPKAYKVGGTHRSWVLPDGFTIPKHVSIT